MKERCRNKRKKLQEHLTNKLIAVQKQLDVKMTPLSNKMWTTYDRKMLLQTSVFEGSAKNWSYTTGQKRQSQVYLLDRLHQNTVIFKAEDCPPFAGSFVVGKGAFGTVTLRNILHMDLVVAAKAISGTLNDLKGN